MNAKRLPKAIRRSAGEGTQADKAEYTTGQEASPALQNPPARRRSAAQSAEAKSEPAAPARQQVLPPVRAVVAPEASTAESAAGRRHRQADRIVERYAAYSAGGGIIPLPIVNVAGVTAINIRMAKALSDHYQVSFERDRARAIVVGLLAGVAPTGMGTIAASVLFLLSPASTIMALAVSSLTAATCTRSIGRVFVAHFESLANPG